MHRGYTRHMSTTDYLFDIDVDTCFLDDQSAPEEGRFVFAYTIHIRNGGKVPARLLGRHWLITDGNGKVQEVVGEGVVGEQPLAASGRGLRVHLGRGAGNRHRHHARQLRHARR